MPNAICQIQLEVGATNDTVIVSGETPLLQTRTSDVSTLIESKTVQDLPLGDRRTLNTVKPAGAAVLVSKTRASFALLGRQRRPAVPHRRSKR